jgi:hypothetical protein
MVRADDSTRSFAKEFDMRFAASLFLAALVILSSVNVGLAIPHLINYQGTLTDGGGTPITVATSVVFKIWDDPGAGTMQWSETQVVTPNAAGVFSVLLGSTVPIPASVFESDDAYLGITVDADPEMSPRSRLVSVGYAYRPGTVDGAAGGTISGDVGVTGGNIDLDVSSASAGNILKGGNLFIHDFGTENTFIGHNTGNLTMTGTANTASGYGTLNSNTTGEHNTAGGYRALNSNTTGNQNTASGSFALVFNTTGNNNTATGRQALNSNVTGKTNTAIGVSALGLNDAGSYNTAGGAAALYNNTDGDSNTAIGYRALYDNTTGNNNTAIGYATDVSAGSLTNATAIGYGAVVDASNKIRLGNTDVTVIEGQVPYTFTSDKNQKENFRPVDGDEVLRKIADMNLSSWNYRGQGPGQFRHYGPVAQEFFAAFGHDGVGQCGDSTTINSGDMAGILMIAVQTLNEKLTREQTRNRDLELQIAELREMIRGQTATQD